MSKFLAPALLAATAIAGAAPAQANPDKPLNASSIGRGYGCFTSDANGAEAFDPACETFASVKLDADGNIQHYIYHDSATLTDGQAVPDSAVVIPLDYVVFGLACTGMARITPSGLYSSNQVCTPL